MRERTILVLSLTLNLGLLAGWYFSTRAPEAEPPAESVVVEGSNEAVTVKTNVVVRRQYFSWQEVESQDYPTYIANLRDIGCPEQTIRDIIVADVNQLYARRRAQEVVTAEQQWWRSEPDPEVITAAEAKLAALEEERRTLLTRLLGPGWDPSGPAGATEEEQQTLELSGPILGDLSPEKRAAIQSITEESQRRMRDYFRSQRRAGEEMDPAEVARLRQQTREELAAVLAPAELEEFLLRYSRTSEQLRQQLRGFEVSADEFRRIFRAYDRLDSQVDQFFSADDPRNEEQRRRIEEQKEQALRTAMGNERYAEFQLTNDPDFQSAKTTAQQYGAPPESVLPIYFVNQAVEEEKMSVRMNPTLSEEERIEKLKEIEADHEKSMLGILGEESYRRYLEAQNSNASPPLPSAPEQQ